MCQKDMHYYAVYKLAEQAGFKEQDAYRIAFSSQFVDDCNDFKVENARIQQLVYTRQITKSFRPILTQTSISMEALDQNMQRYVIMPFHFLPGDESGIVKPNSDNAIGLINMAIKSRSTFSLGIALHTYADTWSHQGFTAFEEDANQVVDWKTAYRHVVPNVGHADIGDDCDAVEGVWQDYRKPKGQRRVVNKIRFYETLMWINAALRMAIAGRVLNPQVDPGKIEGWIVNCFAWQDWLDIEDYDDRVEFLNVPKKYGMDDPGFHNDCYKMFQLAAKQQVSAVFSNLVV